MKYRRHMFGMIVSILVLAGVVACGGSPEPTATPVPPTVTPTVAPTTAPPPAAAAESGTLQSALSRVKAATAYRVDLSITGKGNFAAAGGPTPAPGHENDPITLVIMKGEIDGKDAHFTLQGMLTAFLGIEADRPFEVISSNGVAYIKGPVPLLNATEAKWYQAPPEAAQVAQPPLTPSSFLESFGESGINPGDFKKSGTESLESQTCDVYSGDKAAVVNAFSKLGGATGATQEDLDSIDNAEFKFWVCGDGYLHQVKMLIEGHDKNQPDQKGSFEVLMKISDFDSNIQITAPTDAVPLPMPTAAATPVPAVAPTATP